MKIIITIISFFSFLLFFGQQEVDLDTCKTYTSLEEALKRPLEVFILDLSKQKLKDVPKEIAQLTNLQSLDLSKNKLNNVPFELKTLANLKKIDLGKNQLSVFPIVLTELTNLESLVINQNMITAIPHDINKLIKLRYLDMWSNDLYIIPDSMSELKALKTFDLRVIQFSQAEQERISKLLPDTKIHFSNTCNCAH